MDYQEFLRTYDAIKELVGGDLNKVPQSIKTGLLESLTGNLDVTLRKEIPSLQPQLELGMTEKITIPEICNEYSDMFEPNGLFKEKVALELLHGNIPLTVNELLSHLFLFDWASSNRRKTLSVSLVSETLVCWFMVFAEDCEININELCVADWNGPLDTHPLQSLI